MVDSFRDQLVQMFVLYLIPNHTAMGRGSSASCVCRRMPHETNHAHDLRRTCARNAYTNGASLLLVQAMLGHEDPKTTARYIGADETDDDTAVDYVRY